MKIGVGDGEEEAEEKEACGKIEFKERNPFLGNEIYIERWF